MKAESPKLVFGVLAALACLITSSSVRAQVPLVGGSAHERAMIGSVEQLDLAGLMLPRSSLLVRIVSPKQMAAIVSQGGVAPPSARADDEDDEIDGLYDSPPPTITMVSGEDSDAEFELTFVHEYGHHVWLTFLGDWDRSQYGQIYARSLAAHQLVSEYATDSVEEGFAESFAYFIMEPRTLLKRDPASYLYMKSLAARIRLACAAATEYDREHAESE